MIISLVTCSPRKRSVVRVCSLNDHECVGEARRRCRNRRVARSAGMATSETSVQYSRSGSVGICATLVTCGRPGSAGGRPFPPGRRATGVSARWRRAGSGVKRRTLNCINASQRGGAGPRTRPPARGEAPDPQSAVGQLKRQGSMGKSLKVNDPGRKLSCRDRRYGRAGTPRWGECDGDLPPPCCSSWSPAADPVARAAPPGGPPPERRLLPGRRPRRRRAPGVRPDLRGPHGVVVVDLNSAPDTHAALPYTSASCAPGDCAACKLSELLGAH
jgi:hypothetical protein